MFTEVTYLDPLPEQHDPDCLNQEWLEIMQMAWSTFRLYSGFLHGEWKSNNTTIGEC